MNVEAFLICDAATDSMGKLNILGAFDTLHSPSFPTVHPQCSVAVRLRLQRIEKGSHQFAVHIIDDDGKFMIPSLNGTVDVVIPESERSAVVNFVLNFQSLKIDREGELAVVLHIDGKELSRLPLHVKKAS
jgi:hypothetical protein